MVKISIRTRLVIAFFLVGAISVLVVGFLSINTVSSSLQKEAVMEMVRLSEAKEWQIFIYFDLLESRTLDFSSDGFIKDSMEKINKGENSSEVVQKLNAHIILNKQPLDKSLLGILIIDPNGKVVASTDKDDVGKDESDDAYFIEGKKGSYVSDPDEVGGHFSTVKKKVVASVPIIDTETKQLLGVIVNFFETEKLYDMLTGHFILNKGALTVEGGDIGLIDVYVVDRKKSMFILPKSAGAIGSGVFTEKLTVDTLPVRKCLENNEEMSGTYTNYAGKEVVGSSMCIVDKKWTLLVEKSTDDAYMLVRELQTELVFIVIAIIGLAGILGFVFSATISRPIKKLTKTIEDISLGKMDTEVEGKERKDEIGDLARAFDRTIVSLKLAKRRLGIKETTEVSVTPEKLAEAGLIKKEEPTNK